ncbi:MAG TPA: HAD family phosphatase [Gaiella sp.]|nr:HAD family phosphatase [Gaiella sp.]
MPEREPIEAVVFDLDGVLVDTEQLWDEVREALTEEWGGRYTPEAQEAMMGMSSPEWSRYLHEVVGLREPPEVIKQEVVRRMLARYETELPVIPGAVEAVRRLAGEGYRLAVASSSNRELIDAVLRRLELDSDFAVTVSSEEVARGKPAPDVYLEAAKRLGVDATRCVAVEDSASGIRAAHAAGMRVIAYPNRHYPPAAETLSLVNVVVTSVDDVATTLSRNE